MVKLLRADRLWLAWLAAGVLAIAGYFCLPAGGWYRDVAYYAIGLTSAVVILVAARRQRPPLRRMWYLVGAGQAIWVLGDVIYNCYRYVGREPFPSVADVFYLGAYPLLIAGLLVLVHDRSAGRDRAALIDAGIVSAGLGLLSWAFLMRPIAEDSSIEMLPRLISLAYPVADALMLVVLARLFTGAGARNGSFRLLAVAVILLIGSDTAFSLVSAYSSYSGGPIDGGWLLSYVMWAAAALHPSARSVPEVAADRRTRLTRRRLALLTSLVLLAPALLVVQGLTDRSTIDWAGIGTGAVVLFLLVLARMSGLVAQVQDQANRLADLAMHDDLTGLANRRLIQQRIGKALSAADPGRVQVAVVDLDDFKDINDRLGHGVGDLLLVAVGERLRSALRPAAEVARLGGDEFALLIPGTDDAEADATVERVLSQLHRPFSAGGHHLLVRASIGLTNGTGATEPFELLRRADLAMYAAKEAGGRRSARYGAELDRRTIEHARLGAQLREGLDAGQFRLVYQPIVTLPYGRIAAVEALVRWQHPQRGLVDPAQFIPIAERNGLIVELGDWILREACRQAVEWHLRLGPSAPAYMTVNVSARQLAEPGFAGSVAAALAHTGLPAGALAVEVTETAVFGGGRSLDELNAVHDLGVRVALDDFGTGHSSLGLLQTTPVDILKVDKTFVDNIGMAGRHSVIAAALINVSEGLHLTAVAEGVETADQAAQLYLLGYRFAQGYHFGRPMSATALGELCTQQSLATR